MAFTTNPSIVFSTGFTGACSLDDDIKLQFGSGTDYWFHYRSAGTAFELISTDTAGGGEDGIVFKVEDGTNDVDFIGDIVAVAATFSGAVSTGALTTSTIVASGIIKTDDATDATSGTDGSLQTDGGLSVVKDGFIGNDLDVVGRVVTSTVTTLANDGTPTVAAGNLFKTGGTTAITDFDNGVVGQTIEILSAHAITITDGSPIILAASANFVMAAGDTLVLTMYNDQVWNEVSRTVEAA